MSPNSEPNPAPPRADVRADADAIAATNPSAHGRAGAGANARPIAELAAAILPASARLRGEDQWRLALHRVLVVVVLVAAVFYGIKAAEDRSAFLRWRIQILQFDQGVNIYEDMLFPTPPIMPLMLYPLMKLPPMIGALLWFLLKAGMAAASVAMCLRMARDRGAPIPVWVEGLVYALAARPFLSDLHHGNNNLLILFLVASALYLWHRSRDFAAGIVLALAVACKVTPAIFALYIGFKWLWALVVDRAARPAFASTWKTVAGGFLGLFLFLQVVPGLALGWSYNNEMLATWWDRIIRPYVSENVVGAQEVNQSMVGVVTRLLTDERGEGRYAVKLDVNLADLDRKAVAAFAKGLSLLLLAWTFWRCRLSTTRRDDPRLLGEFALVALAALFVSERSWKHHYVTLVFPFAYLVYRLALPSVPNPAKIRAAAALVAASALIALTSSEGGYLLAAAAGLAVLAALVRAGIRANPRLGPGQWRALVLGGLAGATGLALLCGPAYADLDIHKYAQAYGAYFWAGLVLYFAVARQVRDEWTRDPFAAAANATRGNANANADADRPGSPQRLRRDPPDDHAAAPRAPHAVNPAANVDADINADARETGSSKPLS